MSLQKNDTLSDDEIRRIIGDMGERARRASRILAVADTEAKNAWLSAMADALERDQDRILAANAEDMAEAKQNGISSAMLDRLHLTPERLRGMADAVRHVVTLPDPVGRILSETTRPNGLKIQKVSVPIGVIGFIYESRPNVTSDAASLCLKAGNAVILRGGSEALRSNLAIGECISKAGAAAGMPCAGEACSARSMRQAFRSMKWRPLYSRPRMSNVTLRRSPTAMPSRAVQRSLTTRKSTSCG